MSIGRSERNGLEITFRNRPETLYGTNSDQPAQVTLRQPSCHCRSTMSDDDVALPSTERLVDGVVQSVNVVQAVAGCIVLGVLAGAHADPLRLTALAVYAAGLLAMVGCSALYAWGRGGGRHSLYRHLDHAATVMAELTEARGIHCLFYLRFWSVSMQHAFFLM